MRLDHVSIVCEDSTLLRRFFVEVAGLEDGPRPAFCVGGYWLYLEGRPVLHLIERPAAYQATAASQSAARIDHLALRIDDAGEWQALLERLHASGTPYQLVDA
jgi:extradiol dioxygenase family protein